MNMGPKQFVNGQGFMIQIGGALISTMMSAGWLTQKLIPDIALHFEAIDIMVNVALGET